jgi:hypothetical protein
MPKKTKDESDESRLKEKVSARWKDNPGSDEKFRALRKRLKRAQRKRRGMVARKVRAAGKGKKESGAAT